MHSGKKASDYHTGRVLFVFKLKDRKALECYKKYIKFSNDVSQIIIGT